jgi:peptidyl-prolyl cis-trans isomerase SurA
MLVLAPASAHAQSGRIAAVVNNNAITVTDVAQRMRMIMQSAGMPDKKDVRERLRQRVLDNLIEEQLKLQKAGEMGITIKDSRIEKGIATIAKRNDVPAGQFKAMFEKQGIPLATLRRQVKAQMAWSQVVKRKLRPKINISRSDVAARRDQLKQTIGKPQYRLAEIFLSARKKDEEVEARALAEKLLDRLKGGNASFPQLARQFSQSASAARGGNMGWMRAAQLPEAVRKAVKSMESGSLAGPVKSMRGYHILYLREKRTLSKEDLPGDEQLRQRIGMERLNRLQKRYLLDLKSQAFIEKRI